jgi:hypothetical protein
MIAMPPTAGNQPHHHAAVTAPELFRVIWALAMRGWPRSRFVWLIVLGAPGALFDLLLLAPPTILLTQIGGAVVISVGLLPRFVQSLCMVVRQGYSLWLLFGTSLTEEHTPHAGQASFQK